MPIRKVKPGVTLPYMPWYPGDFLKSTRGWHIAARGAYRELLDHQWDSESLPEDPEELRAIVANISEENWRFAWLKIESKFPVSKADGKRRNPRLDSERRHAMAVLAAKIRGGKASQKKQLERQLETQKQDRGRYPDPDPDPVIRAQGSNVSVKPYVSGADTHADFEAIKAAYPKFSGRQDWINAQHHAHQRIDRDGTTWRQLLEAVKRYADYCAHGGVSGQQYVLTPAKFFSAIDQPWKQAWEAPKKNGYAKPDQSAAWAELKTAAQDLEFRAPHEGEPIEAYRTDLMMHKNKPPKFREKFSDLAQKLKGVH